MHPATTLRTTTATIHVDGVRPWRVWALWLVSFALLTGCGLDFENRHAREEVLAMSQPAGSVHWGWQVFQARCASCHGEDAAGTLKGPNLLLRMQDLGPKRFETLVLMRYDLSLPVASQYSPAKPPPKPGATPMPAWQGVPSVQTQIANLYRYLSERAQGHLGPGEPLGP